MNINQNIKDAIKASVGIIAIVTLITVGAEIYKAATNSETEEVYGFITFALTLHEDFDENEAKDDILDLIDIISSAQTEDYQEIYSLVSRESRLIRYYKESFYLLISPTDEMWAIKESLIEEASLFLMSCSRLREALESKVVDDDYNAYLLNIEEATQYLDDAMNLRIENRAELDRWKTEIEAELSD